MDDKTFYAILGATTDLNGDIYQRIRNIRSRIANLEAVTTDKTEKHPHTRYIQISVKLTEANAQLNREVTLLRDILAVIKRENL